MIRHESINKSIRGRLHEDTRKRAVEEKWIAGNLIVEALRAESCQGVEIDDAVGRHRDELPELVDDELVVVAGLVEIGSGG